MLAASPNFLSVANAWAEQRKFADLTIEALSNHSVVKDIYAELLHLKPSIPDLTGMLKFMRYCNQSRSYELVTSRPIF
jgi:hypothetical protein